MEQFNEAMSQQRKEISKLLDDFEKKRLEIQQEVDKRYQIKFGALDKHLSEINQRIPLEIEKQLQSIIEEDTRRKKLLSEWESRMQDMVQMVEDIQKSQKNTDETNRQDNKKLVDFQGDIVAFRKRLDEYREKTDLNSDSFRRLEIRLNELLASDSERKVSLANFQEAQTRFQVERDRLLKELEDRLNNMRSQNEKMDGQIQDWEASQRAVKRAKDSYDEIAQKFDRRINEITEMQRLAEDRFRQEWITFKADDQKRWTSYTLSQDEIHKDSRTGNEKMEQRLSTMEDLIQTQQDMLQQTKDANEQLFQGMLSQIHELLASYERIMGSK